MDDSDQNNAERLLKLLSDVENRIENLREQAMSIKREKESILGLLQDMHDNTEHMGGVTDVDKEDMENTSARLIMRCLSVDVSVSTPRNETQEEAYKAVSKIIDSLSFEMETSSKDQSLTIESYLNACLSDPISSSIDSRFQSKLLGCTADDQKLFRKQLQTMHKNSLKDLMCNINSRNRSMNGQEPANSDQDKDRQEKDTSDDKNDSKT